VVAVPLPVSGCASTATTPSPSPVATPTPSPTPTATPSPTPSPTAIPATPSPAPTSNLGALSKSYLDTIVLVNILWAKWLKSAGASSNAADPAISGALAFGADAIATNGSLQIDPANGKELSTAFSNLATEVEKLSQEANAVAGDPAQGYLLLFEAGKVQTAAALVRHLLQLPALSSDGKTLL
jgi:hypothetical protein